VADRHVDFLLIGGGVASASCARALREAGAEGSVLVVGRELDAPYHRPPISKDYLQGRQTREATLVAPAEWWGSQDIELLTRTSVTALDLQARVATLSTKEQVGFGQALLATGAMVRRLNVPGAELEGIHYLRALGNADALRRDLEGGGRVVLVGGSYIGCEVAASLTALGKHCSIVMLEEATFERAFGVRAGRHLQQILEGRGIEVHGQASLERFEGASASGEGPGRVSRVVVSGDRELEADVVVCGVGAVPDVMLARRAGLEIGELGGVRVDATLQTAVPGVYAAGDICEYDSVIHGRSVRIEHEQVAIDQGATVAANMLGAGRAHSEVPYFFSDLYDWASLEYVGPAQAWDEERVRGAMADGAFSVWYLDRGRVAAMLSVGRPEDLPQARRLITEGVSLAGRTPLLEDLSTDLASITLASS
jgi:3-phenylpropionate/trans-cinnamate dioxygenase ferredoxin reductase subunit